MGRTKGAPNKDKSLVLIAKRVIELNPKQKGESVTNYFRRIEPKLKANGSNHKRDRVYHFGRQLEEETAEGNPGTGNRHYIWNYDKKNTKNVAKKDRIAKTPRVKEVQQSFRAPTPVSTQTLLVRSRGR